MMRRSTPFYAQVHLVQFEQETNDEHDDNLLWRIGTNYRELATVEELAEAVADFCPLPPETQLLLLIDKWLEASEPTGLQKQMLEFTSYLSVTDRPKQKMD